MRTYALLSLAAMAAAAGAQPQAQPAAQPKPGGETLVVAIPKATYVNRTEAMRIWGHFFSHLSRCANVSLRNQMGESLDQTSNLDLLTDKELMDGIKAQKIQLAQVTPGMVPPFVAGGENAPFAVAGNKASKTPNSYRLVLVSRVDSPYRAPADLVGKKIAHTTPSSNSGNMAPRALFPAIGLTPEKNYEVVFSNGHERSVMGVMHGFYDAAATASDVVQRMVVKGDIRASSLRVIWQSQPFLTETWMMSKAVPADVQERVRKCTYSYAFPDNLRKLMPNMDTYLPVNYEKDFAAVREVYNQSKPAGN